ncbi:hypothetical protein AY599_15125 [Leptolyngbya valderiana BDU 20041]|nr:hypothetical protein AY599_15125 [Leptolyngbya valderiana BDU 20041]
MSTKPVIIALSAAIAIVVASTWLLRPPSASTALQPQSVLDVDAASIVSFETRGAAGKGARIERVLTGWQLVSPDGPPWAVEDGRARAAARILADLQGRPVDEPQSAPVAMTLTIEDARGRTMSLGLREPVVGGQRIVDRIDVDGVLQRFAIDEPLYEAFVETGLPAWRNAGLLGALPGRPARLELARGSSRLELARVDGQWSLRAPVATRANEQGIESLLQAIARLWVERFDEPAPPAVQAQDPVTITIEADRSEPGDDPTRPVRITERLTLTLHGPADTGGRLTLVGVSREQAFRTAGAAVEYLGATHVAVDLEPLQNVTLEPRGYVAPTALDGDASMIARLTLDERTYERTASGWSEQGRDLAVERAAALDALAALLTTTTMTGVELTDAPTPTGSASRPVTITAATIAGEPLTPPGGLVLRVVQTPSGASGALVIGDGVTREYTDAASTATARAAMVLSEPDADPSSGG